MLLFLSEFADSDKSIHIKPSDYDPGVCFFVVHVGKLGGSSGTEIYSLEKCCYLGLSDRCKKLPTWVFPHAQVLHSLIASSLLSCKVYQYCLGYTRTMFSHDFYSCMMLKFCVPQ